MRRVIPIAGTSTTMHPSRRFLCILILLATTQQPRVEALQPRNLPCDFLPDNPTWNDLRNALDQPSEFAYLCPFRIEGAGCPQSVDDSNRKYTVEQSIDQSLVCDLTAGVESECVIDCPLVGFVVQGGFTAESITFRNYNDPVVVVNPGGTFSSKASKFEDGAQGAIQGMSQSSIKIIQGSIVSGNNMNNTQRGAGVSTLGQLEIDGSTFSENVNDGNGGGAVYAGPEATVIVTGSTFRANTAEFGPAVFTDAPRAQVTFENNRACNNVGSFGDAASCNGIYLFSPLECITFGKGCIPEPGACVLIECIWEWLRDLISSIISFGPNIDPAG